LPDATAGDKTPAVAGLDALTSRWRESIRRHLARDGEADRDRSSIKRVESVLGPLLFPAWDEVMLPAIASTGAWEPATSAWLESHLHRGDRAVVAGANVGYHAITIARAVGPSGRVVAFEPDALNFELLRCNLAINQIENVHAILSAVGDRSGVATLSIDETNAGHHRAYERVGAGFARHIEVPIVELDAVLGDTRVDVVLSDTQSFDHRVVRGMSATVARCHPLMLVQYWTVALGELGDDPAEVIEYYRSLGYDVGVLEDPTFAHESPARLFVEFADQREGRCCSLVLTPVEP
jgi:FkbM family methyltransferase